MSHYFNLRSLLLPARAGRERLLLDYKWTFAPATSTPSKAPSPYASDPCPDPLFPLPQSADETRRVVERDVLGHDEFEGAEDETYGVTRVYLLGRVVEKIIARISGKLQRSRVSTYREYAVNIDQRIRPKRYTPSLIDRTRWALSLRAVSPDSTFLLRLVRA